MESERIWEEDTYSEIKEELIKENRKYWMNRTNVTQGEKWIYVYHGMSGYHFDWAVHEDIVAKGLQAKTHLPIISVIDGFGRALPDGLDESFGISEVTHLFYSRYIDEQSERTTYETAKALAEETYQDKDKLLQLEYRGIKFGDELYDDLLLRNWKNDVLTFDCFDISLEEYARCIRNALSLIDHAFALFSQKCPAYVITSEKLQLKRLFGDIARAFGAKEIVVMPSWPEELVQISSETENKKIYVSDCIRAVLRDNYLKDPESCLGANDEAFILETDRKSEKYDLLKQLGISNRNMNVFVLPHALIDVPRESSRINFYHDYAEWFLETLKMIKKIPNVNWIIKDHPMTAYFKQGEFIKKVFMENKAENMYWCDADIGGMYIKEFADRVVTCGGDAALEYWAYGIPTITTAVTHFSELGISYNMKTLDDYKYTLERISELARPSEKSITEANKILYTAKRLSNSTSGDELTGLFMKTRKIQCKSYCSGLSFQHIHTFCEGYLHFLKQGFRFEESNIYQIRELYEV